MPGTKACNSEIAKELRRGAAAAAARGMRHLADVLSERAGEMETPRQGPDTCKAA